ncbi:MAG: FAD-binding oxidoreductase, partial [Gaiellaceae bacterium]
MSTLPERADVVVVGGGAVGTSIAFHLAEAGVDVCLLERDSLSSGSTSRAAGGIRTQFSDPLNIAIGLRSVEAFTHFAERPGGEIDFHQVGYLFLLDRPDDVAVFEESVAVQNGLGVPSRLVQPAEAAKLSPLAGLDDVLAATYCPLDGHASPEAVAQGYAAGARAHGAAVITGSEATAIEADAGRVKAVVTDDGTIETGAVVCAAGVWSPHLARTAGVDLPVEPVFREVVTTAPVAGLPAQIPLTVDFTTGFYFHREGPGLLIGMADRNQLPGFDA